MNRVDDDANSAPRDTVTDGDTLLPQATAAVSTVPSTENKDNRIADARAGASADVATEATSTALQLWDEFVERKRRGEDEYDEGNDAEAGYHTVDVRDDDERFVVESFIREEAIDHDSNGDDAMSPGVAEDNDGEAPGLSFIQRALGAQTMQRTRIATEANFSFSPTVSTPQSASSPSPALGGCFSASAPTTPNAVQPELRRTQSDEGTAAVCAEHSPGSGVTSALGNHAVEMNMTAKELAPEDEEDTGGVTSVNDGDIVFEYESDNGLAGGGDGTAGNAAMGTSLAGGYIRFALPVVHRNLRTGFEEEKEIRIEINEVIAERYQILGHIGAAAFSTAVEAYDLRNDRLVCMKIIKNNKDFFDQSLDEIKVLSHVNGLDAQNTSNVVQMLDYFYHREHLFIVFELCRANLYEVQRKDVAEAEAEAEAAAAAAAAAAEKVGEENCIDTTASGIAADTVAFAKLARPRYLTPHRLRHIARQVLTALDFLHRECKVIHADLKPENILIKNYARCDVKVIDLGSSCFVNDRLSGYVQSRSYRAPEVILGLPYSSAIDIWSLGCVLAELANSRGEVLFTNDDVSCILARMVGILGDIPLHMLETGAYSQRYFSRSGLIFNRQEDEASTNVASAGIRNDDASGMLQYVIPKASSLRARVDIDDDLFLDFLGSLLVRTFLYMS